jgi:hypothetical protein
MPKRRARRTAYLWATWPQDRLLDLPLRRLHLRLRGTALESRIEQLRNELARAGLRFRPYCWLSTAWFTPERATGFAIPFFLAHPRLARLERRHMLEVEGGTRDQCMRLLRHETAHALSHAYRLHERVRWKRVFGSYDRPYRATYTPDPTSRRFVTNLDNWYAQSHPAEDFAETFAVWLRPGWRTTYAGWPALQKLLYVDELMGEIARRPPRRHRRIVEPLAELDLTLREYYAKKERWYSEQSPHVYDEHLLGVFRAVEARDRGQPAARWLRRARRELVQRVSWQTGQSRYLIDHVLREMIARCRRLGLRLAGTQRDTMLDAAILLTALTMEFPTRGRVEYGR